MSVTPPLSPSPQKPADFTSYLTFKLDLLKTEMNRRANLIYRQEFGLDVRLLRVLRAICDLPGRTASEVRDLTLIEKTLLSKMMAELIEKKLVRRTIHPDDARHYQLWPTASGTRVRIASDKIGHAMEQEMLAVLSAPERNALELILGKLVDGLSSASSAQSQKKSGAMKK
ncbi:MarR family winged helix-turn-helix transcriptional regulator [Noviherbaspirillum galbum]|uniref:Winged helix-turn-helix transcriptional regulator n=1 Tax=Noviherbaspirillum galbum TaxID=2709383 RepID=A0A6B3SNR8_9BURK|nr:MarR family winged helix-turn-helix transcriptional regulator [Noviherbaspirillum galbum]NEX62520.1 winged helix-turn-helix transcriptional regulator [Noviherbaspirillum galbum]